MSAVIAALLARIEALERQVGLQASLARTTLAVDDTGRVQKAQAKIDALSARDGIPVLFHYGYSANLPVGTDKLVISLRGDRSQGIAIATGHQTYRVTALPSGAVCLYDMWGKTITLGPSKISVNCNGFPFEVIGATTANFTASTSMTFTTPLAQFSGDVVDRYATNTLTLAGARADYDAHTHLERGVGGQTGTPSVVE